MPSSGPLQTGFPAPFLRPEACLAWGSEGRDGKGRSQKLEATKCLSLGPTILAPSSVHIPYSLSLPRSAPASSLTSWGPFPADSGMSLPPLLHSVTQMGLRCAMCWSSTGRMVPIITWRLYSSVTDHLGDLKQGACLTFLSLIVPVIPRGSADRAGTMTGMQWGTMVTNACTQHRIWPGGSA